MATSDCNREPREADHCEPETTDHPAEATSLHMEQETDKGSARYAAGPTATGCLSRASTFALAALAPLELAIMRPTPENTAEERLQAIADGFRAAADALVPVGNKTLTAQSVELATVPIVLAVGGWTGRPKACKLPADIIMDIARMGLLAGIRMAGGELMQERDLELQP